ncbi:13561_t:CDS:2, partial [Gigaspora rosea]
MFYFNDFDDHVRGNHHKYENNQSPQADFGDTAATNSVADATPAVDPIPDTNLPTTQDYNNVAAAPTQNYDN